MKKRYYIAYGSNLSVEQMARRCPEATVAGLSTLIDWKLVFRTHATIEPCNGRTVPVLIWKISDNDERNLDYYEGFPVYYYKQNLDVTMTDFEGNNPQEITAMVYIMSNDHNIEMPNRNYLETLTKGYLRFGFDIHQLELAVQESRV